MVEDPIVEEVRHHRQEWAAKFGYDLDAMVKDLRERERTSGHKVLQPPKKKPAKSARRAG